MTKSIKFTFVLFTLILGWPLKGAAQTTMFVTLVAKGITSTNYLVQTNQIISLVGYDWIDKPVVNASECELSPPAVTLASQLSLPNLEDTFAYPPTFAIPQIVTGATNIMVDGPGWATFKITTPAAATGIPNYVPADAVVIPSSVVSLK
jgi:hypothetical protein